MDVTVASNPVLPAQEDVWRLIQEEQRVLGCENGCQIPLLVQTNDPFGGFDDAAVIKTGHFITDFRHY